MNDILSFSFDGQEVRTAIVDGETYFVATDIARTLGYSDPHDAVKSHCKGSVKRLPLKTQGGTQDTRIISESDVYRLIIKSRLPSAEKFEKWIMEEVLPSIRKNGGYLAPTVDFSDPDVMRKVFDAWAADREKLEAAKAKIAIDAPKVEAHDVLMRTDTAMSITDAAKHFGLHPKLEVFPWLREHGYLTKYDLPTQKALDADILVMVEVPVSSGITKRHAKVETWQLDNWYKKVYTPIQALKDE